MHANDDTENGKVHDNSDDENEEIHGNNYENDKDAEVYDGHDGDESASECNKCCSPDIEKVVGALDFYSSLA
eukprot:8039683-Ditylum_brightwellii.AAC.1